MHSWVCYTHTYPLIRSWDEFRKNYYQHALVFWKQGRNHPFHIGLFVCFFLPVSSSRPCHCTQPFHDSVSQEWNEDNDIAASAEGYKALIFVIQKMETANTDHGASRRKEWICTTAFSQKLSSILPTVPVIVSMKRLADWTAFILTISLT